MYVQGTLQSSGVSLKLKPRISNIYLHGKQNKVVGGVKYAIVNDVLARSCNDGDMRIYSHVTIVTRSCQYVIDVLDVMYIMYVFIIYTIYKFHSIRIYSAYHSILTTLQF